MTRFPFSRLSPGCGAAFCAAFCASVLALLLGLAGCGGGGSESPSAPAADVPDATVGPAGASVHVQGLSLTLPAGAVDAPVALSLRQSPAEGADVARFSVFPAGRLVKAPAELRFERSGLPARSSFFWEVAGELWMVPSTQVGAVLTARIDSFGYGAAAAAAVGRAQPLRSRAAPFAAPTPGSAALVIQQVDCQRHITELAARLAASRTQSDLSLSFGLAKDVEATEATCVQLNLQVIEQRSCEALDVAVANARVLLADSFQSFQSITAPLIGAKAYVDLSAATCTAGLYEQVDGLIEAKFDQFLQVLQSQTLRGDFATQAGAREVATLLTYKGICDSLSLGTVCDRIGDVILPNLFDGMRIAAFDECRASGSGLVVSQLHGLAGVVTNEAKFLDFGRFSPADLEADLSFCTDPSLDLHVFDNATDVPEELVTRAQNLRPLVGLGQYRASTDIEVPRKGSLTVGGRVPALRCADTTALPADLVARVGGVEVGRRPVVGNAFALTNSPFDLVTSRVLAAAGLDPDKTNSYTLVITREGGQCNDLFGPVFDVPFKLFEVRVNLPPAAPTTFALRGSVTVQFQRSTVDGAVPGLPPNRQDIDFAVGGTVVETAGRLALVGPTVTGGTVEKSTSVRSMRTTTPEGNVCTFEQVFSTTRTSVFVPGAGLSASVDIFVGTSQATVTEFTLRGTKRTHTESTAKIQNVVGNCNPPTPDPTSGDDNFPQSSVNFSLALVRSPAFTGTVTTDSQGRRSVSVSGALTESGPTATSGTQTLTSSVALSLADVAQ